MPKSIQLPQMVLLRKYRHDWLLANLAFRLLKLLCFPFLLTLSRLAEGSCSCPNAASLPRRYTSSCWGVLGLLGRRALAPVMPTLRGKTCPSFARWYNRSSAACRRRSAPYQYVWYCALEGR